MHPTVLIPADVLATRVAALGAELTATYAGRAPLMLVLMDGAYVFAADLARSVQLPDLRLQFRRAASYQGTTSTGRVALAELPALAGEDVVVVDDILDTGRTLGVVLAAARDGGARTVRTCVLLDKPGRRIPGGIPRADFTGFAIADRFVVGYGLDYDGRFRHLPYVGVLDG